MDLLIALIIIIVLCYLFIGVAKLSLWTILVVLAIVALVVWLLRRRKVS